MFLSLPNELLLDIAETLTDTTDVFHLLMTNKHVSTLLQPVLIKASNELLTSAAANELPLLHYAAQENKLSAAKLALKLDPGCVNRSISGKGTALHVAVFNGCESVVEFLLHHGADPNAPKGRAATTPLQMALARIVEVQLVQVCPSDEIEGVAMLLLRHGADPTGISEHGMNALLYAARLGLPRIVEGILDTGTIDIDSRTAWGSTALHIAVERSDTRRVAEVLLARGIDVNATNSLGQTALFRCRHRGVTELLLQYGADVGVVDQFSRTALHHLADWVYPEGAAAVAQLILGAGGVIDVGLRGIDGLSAMDIAEGSGNVRFVEVLEVYEMEELVAMRCAPWN